MKNIQLEEYITTLKYRPGFSTKFRKKDAAFFYQTLANVPNQMDYICEVSNPDLNYIKGLKELTGYSDPNFDVYKLMDLIHPEDLDKCLFFMDSCFNALDILAEEAFKSSASIIYRLRCKGGKLKRVIRESFCSSLDEQGNMTSHYSRIRDVSNSNEKQVKSFWSYKGKIVELHSAQSEVQFSKQEKKIIQFIADGLTSAQIADKLCVAKSTIDRHRHNILQKAKLSNSSQLVEFANTYGLLPLFVH